MAKNSRTDASQDAGFSRSELTGKAIRECRERLLDLTMGNRLLNFPQGSSSDQSVRLVDEVPVVLCSKLIGGQPLTFEPVPMPEQIPADERTDAFEAALKAARDTDEIWIEAKKALGPRPRRAKLHAIERGLRTRVRAACGMAPWEPTENVKEQAEKLGIDTSFDLPAAPDPEKGSHSDSLLQTLFFPDDLAARLEAIHKRDDELAKDAGINALYAAFGFLEWYESKESGVKRYAPLFLYPVSIGKRLEASIYRYAISGRDEDHAVNASLIEKLKRDFGFVLPDVSPFETEIGIDFPKWFATIEDAARGVDERWRVRNWATVAILLFQKITIWEDLDPNNWPEGLEPDRNLLTQQIICGGLPGDSPIAADHEIDAVEDGENPPLLITDADSSQHSAVVDALSGRSIVIQGPPGTGKSQTITNIIAAAIERGKSVLFVAEKMAALEVVKSRMDDAGLGEFCLELHSDKASRAQVLQALSKRMKMTGPSVQANEIEAARIGLSAARKRLREYVVRMNQPAGNTGRSVHDILWGHAKHHAAARPMPAAAAKARIADALEMTPYDVSDLVRIARSLERAAANLGDRARPSAQAWRGIRRPDLTSFHADEVVQHMKRLREALRSLLDATDELAGLADIPFPAPKLLEIGPVATRFASRLPTVPDGVSGVLALVASDHAREAARGLCDAAAARPKLIDEANGIFERTDGETLALIDGIWSTIDGCDFGALTLPEARRRLAEESAALKTASAEAMLAKRIWTMIGMPSASDAEIVGNALKLASIPRLDPLLRPLRHRSLADEAVQHHLTRLSGFADGIDEILAEIGEDVETDEIPSASDLRSHAAALRTTGVLRRAFGGTYRNAVAAYGRILPGKPGKDREEMAKAFDAAIEWRRRTKEFEECRQSSPALAALVTNHKAPFEKLKKTAAWMSKVRAAWPAGDPVATQLRRRLFEADGEELEAIDDYQQDSHPGLAKLAETLNEDESTDAAIARMSASKLALDAVVSAATKLKLKDGLPLRLLETAREKLAASTKLQEASERLLTDQPQLSRLDLAQPGAVERLRLACDFLDAVQESGLGARTIAEIASPGADDKLKAIADVATRILASGVKVQQLLGEIDDFLDIDALVWAAAETLADADLNILDERAHRAIQSPSHLAEQCMILALEQEARAKGLSAVIDIWISADAAYDGIGEAVEAVWYRSAAEALVKNDPALATHAGQAHEEIRRRYADLDRQILEKNRQFLAGKLSRRPIPQGTRAGPARNWSGRALIEYQCGLQRPSMHLRDLFTKAGDAIRALTPCIMMSPMSVSRYLKAGMHKFDVLVVDEASQLRPEDAIGSLLRADQAVIVGDPKQLPPSDFFNAAAAPTDAMVDDVIEESVLELGMRSWRPIRFLSWHYRSRHESLIAFSNARFYDHELLVFPSAHARSAEMGLRLVEVNGAYDDNQNMDEATAIVEEAAAFMARNPEKSLGIVAMNVRQRDLISTLMDQRFIDDPAAESYRQNWSGKLEKFFVKNLENVQGDERDAIFVSTLYGRTPAGGFSQNFGPINKQAGHRRLNVLFTRAKERMTVFTSLDPALIEIAGGSSYGLRIFKEFLAYAKTGHIEETVIRPDGAPESEFERWFLERLKDKGYDAVPQVGVDRFRIDIGIRHPDQPGRFILGLECDGASYHSAKSARDRDRLRQAVLERLGWTIHRIWSTDWFRDPTGELARLVGRIEEIRSSDASGVVPATA